MLFTGLDLISFLLPENNNSPFLQIIKDLRI